MALIGRIPVEINQIEVVKVTNVDVTPNTPATVKKFMNGSTDVVRGIADYGFTLKCQIEADKQSILDQIDSAVASSPDGTFELGYKLGTNYWTLLSCVVTTAPVSSSTDDATLTITGIAGGRIKNS